MKTPGARAAKDFGWLKALRVAQGLSHQAVAARLDMSEASLLEAEKRQSTGDLSIRELRQHAACLECELFYTLIPGPGAEHLIPGLTPKQQHVMALLATGRLNKEIAGELGLKEATVKVHVACIMGKLGLRRRTQLAVFAHLLVPVLQRSNASGKSIQERAVAALLGGPANDSSFSSRSIARGSAQIAPK